MLVCSTHLISVISQMREEVLCTLLRESEGVKSFDNTIAAYVSNGDISMTYVS